MKSKSSSQKGRPTVCIKIGGKAASDESAMIGLVEEIRGLSKSVGFVVVHGGGAEVTRISESFGQTPVFENGVRMTSREEMDVVDMVLSGKMNKTLVRRFASVGIRAIGLSGSDGRLFIGRRLNDNTHTGTILEVKSDILDLLLGNGFLPIIASTSMTEDGTALNINADEAAFAIAADLPADDLVFLSDTEGILTAEGNLIPELDEGSIAENIANGIITGGMIPKVRASLDALRSGTGKIVIGRYRTRGELAELLAGRIGTRILLAEHSWETR